MYFWLTIALSYWYYIDQTFPAAYGKWCVHPFDDKRWWGSCRAEYSMVLLIESRIGTPWFHRCSIESRRSRHWTSPTKIDSSHKSQYALFDRMLVECYPLWMSNKYHKKLQFSASIEAVAYLKKQSLIAYLVSALKIRFVFSTKFKG